MNNNRKNDQNIPIDYDQAMERVGHDKDFLLELIGIFKDEFPKKLKELTQAVDEKNFSVLQKTGHYLKGSSANLSLTFLQEASFSMERSGKEEDIESAGKALQDLKEEFDRLNEFISKGNLD